MAQGFYTQLLEGVGEGGEEGGEEKIPVRASQLLDIGNFTFLCPSNFLKYSKNYQTSHRYLCKRKCFSGGRTAFL